MLVLLKIEICRNLMQMKHSGPGSVLRLVLWAFAEMSCPARPVDRLYMHNLIKRCVSKRADYLPLNLKRGFFSLNKGSLSSPASPETTSDSSCGGSPTKISRD